jgi:hypothetical protein
MDDNRDGDHDRTWWEYIAIAKSEDSDSGKTSRLTALLRQEENLSLLECFRGEGQWHGHGAEAHFEGAPDWEVVIAKLAGLTTPPSTGGGGVGGGGGGERWGTRMDDNRDGDDDGVNVEREDHSDHGFQKVVYKKKKKIVKNLGEATQDDLKDLKSSGAPASPAADARSLVSALHCPHSNMRKEQRGIKFEDIKDAKVKGTVSLAIRFEGENGRGQVMDEISKWGKEIKKEPQFEGIAIGDASAKGRDGDRRMEVELQGSKEHARELKKWLKSKGYFGVPRNRVIYTQDRQQQPVVVVEGQLASLNDEVGIVTLFCRNKEGEEVDVEDIGLCFQCGIVIDKNSKDATCCSFSHFWWSEKKFYVFGRDGKCENCKRTGEDHRKDQKTSRLEGVHNLCYHPDWAKGYDGCCCNCAKDKGWATSGYEKYGCKQCKNKLRLVKGSDGIANLEDIAEELESVNLSTAELLS